MKGSIDEHDKIESALGDNIATTTHRCRSIYNQHFCLTHTILSISYPIYENGGSRFSLQSEGSQKIVKFEVFEAYGHYGYVAHV